MNIIDNLVRFEKINNKEYLLKTDKDIYQEVFDRYINEFTFTRSNMFNFINNDNLVMEILIRMITDSFIKQILTEVKEEEHFYISLNIKNDNIKIAISTVLGDIKGYVYGIVE